MLKVEFISGSPYALARILREKNQLLSDSLLAILQGSEVVLAEKHVTSFDARRRSIGCPQLDYF